MSFGQQPGAQLDDIVGIEPADLLGGPAVSLGQLYLELKRPDRLAPFFVGVA